MTEYRHMLLSDDEADFQLAINLMQNAGISEAEISAMLEDVFKTTNYHYYVLQHILIDLYTYTRYEYTNDVLFMKDPTRVFKLTQRIPKSN